MKLLCGDADLCAKAQLAAHPTAKGKLLSSVAPGFEKTLAEQKESAVVFDDVPEALAGHVVRIRAGRILEEGDE